MKSQARVVVIGGGAVGVSTLYHLTRKGWSDVVLVERKELTSGSTWHAAGLLPLFNMSYSVGQIHKYSVALYQTLEDETGQDVGFRQVSNIRLALNRDRMDEYHQYAGVAETIGVQVEFLTPRQVKEIWPLCNIEGVVGAIRHPEDGYIQPADLTQALARGARAGGAEIYRQTRVTGDRAEAVRRMAGQDRPGRHHLRARGVSATGNFARQTGAMVGLDVPVIPVEHQYIVTEPHPEIVRRQRAGPARDGRAARAATAPGTCARRRAACCSGRTRRARPAATSTGRATDAEYELFPEDLERLTPHIEAAINRVPAFGEVGVKQVYNGAIPYTPDGSPIIGPAWGLRNFWLNEGHSFGITAAGGAGWQLAEWIVEGEPTIDMLGVDPRRFGDYATKAYLRQKNEEAYANVFTIHYPDEERPAGAAAADGALLRPDEGAGRGVRPEVRLGAAELVRAQGHAAGGPLVVPPLALVRARRRRVPERRGERRPARHDRVRQGARLGAAAPRRSSTAWSPTACRSKIGRVHLCHALNTRGGVHSEFTIMREAAGQLLSGLGRRLAAPRPRLAARSTCRTTARSASRT